MRRKRDIFLRLVEIVLLVPAFGFLVPPVASEEGHVYHLFPGLAFAVVFFIASQLVAVLRDRSCWWAAILKALLFVSFGWVLFQRVTM